MRKNLNLSIIIVTFNSTNFIDGCISSIKKTISNTISYEILIFDNSSTDDTVSFVKKTYPWVSLLESKENLGFSKANNFLIKKSGGEYVLLLNPDTVVHDKTIETLIAYLDSHADVAVITPTVLLPDGKLDDASHRGFPTPWNAFCHFVGIGNLFPKSRVFNGYHLGYTDLGKIHEIDSGVGACLLIRRKAGEEVEWFDEDYFWYGEDLDFCYRIKEKGWKVVYDPEVSILHYKGVSSGIKRESESISSASRETKIKATNARFDVMNTFYNKHYKNKYPQIFQQIVLFGIEAKRWLALQGI